MNFRLYDLLGMFYGQCPDNSLRVYHYYCRLSSILSFARYFVVIAVFRQNVNCRPGPDTRASAAGRCTGPTRSGRPRLPRLRCRFPVDTNAWAPGMTRARVKLLITRRLGHQSRGEPLRTPTCSPSAPVFYARPGRDFSRRARVCARVYRPGRGARSRCGFLTPDDLSDSVDGHNLSKNIHSPPPPAGRKPYDKTAERFTRFKYPEFCVFWLIFVFCAMKIRPAVRKTVSSDRPGHGGLTR